MDSLEDLSPPLLLDGTELSCRVGVDTFITIDEDGRALTVLLNHTGCSVTVYEGSPFRVAVPVELVESGKVGSSLLESDPMSGPTPTSQ